MKKFLSERVSRYRLSTCLHIAAIALVVLFALFKAIERALVMGDYSYLGLCALFVVLSVLGFSPILYSLYKLRHVPSGRC